MSHKTLICRCEDVTQQDIEHALEQGYIDIEEVKRYTGFGTGPCQGKQCMVQVALLLAGRAGGPPEQIPPFHARPPFAMTPLKYFAGQPAPPAGASSDEEG
jgi:sarcosine oxidase subunit beta